MPQFFSQQLPLDCPAYILMKLCDVNTHMRESMSQGSGIPIQALSCFLGWGRASSIS
jgi:hypothetical protein